MTPAYPQQRDCDWEPEPDDARDYDCEHCGATFRCNENLMVGERICGACLDILEPLE